MNRARLLQDIAFYLTHLRVFVEHLNSLNLQDINVHAENFFRDFLNVALGYQLKNNNRCTFSGVLFLDCQQFTASPNRQLAPQHRRK